MIYYHRQMKMKMELLPDGMSVAERTKRFKKADETMDKEPESMDDQTKEAEQLPIGVKIGTFKVEIQLWEV